MLIISHSNPFIYSIASCTYYSQARWVVGNMDLDSDFWHILFNILFFGTHLF